MELLRVLHTSSSTPLAAAGVYTSAWQRASRHPLDPTAQTKPFGHDFGWLEGYIESDQASAAGGLLVQQGLVQATPRVQPSFTYWPGQAKFFRIRLMSQWVRLVYTNGAVAQTRLELLFYMVFDG